MLQTDNQIHPSNRKLITGAVFDGPYAGTMVTRSAADWLTAKSHNRQARVAIRRARDGEEGVRFTGSDGVTWNLARTDHLEGAAP